MALKQVIDDNFRLIRRSLDPSPELLARLRSVEVVKQRLVSIKQQPTPNGKNDALLDTLLEVPDDLQETVMNGFIEALRWSDQEHVANMFRKQSDAFPMSDEHYNIIMNKRPTLCQFMTPNDGLVDRLCLSGVFSDTDRTAVLTKPQVDNMAEETLSILLRKCDSCFERFVTALEETGQSHVAYLLTGVGDPPISDQHRAVLREKRFALRQFLNPKDGLVDRLVSSLVFSDTDRTAVLRKMQIDDMAEETLSILLRKSDSCFDIFVRALDESGQSHVACLLTGKGDLPMSDQHCAVLREKRFALRQFLNPRDGLVDRLVSSLIFSVMDGNSVLSKSQEKVEEMADETVTILVRKSDSAFDKFVNSLNETGQSHVAYLLTGVGPQPMSDQHRELLLEKMHELCKFIDVENGLLNRLVSCKVISLEDVREIRSVPDDNVMTEKLVLNLLRKRDDAFHDFVESLNYTGQMHVSYILTGVGDCRPLTDELGNRLLSGQRVPAVKMMDCKHSGFNTARLSRCVYTGSGEQRVVSVSTDTCDNRNEIFLNMIARKSQTALFGFERHFPDACRCSTHWRGDS